jgi:hypothetical protein
MNIANIIAIPVQTAGVGLGEMDDMLPPLVLVCDEDVMEREQLYCDVKV